MVAANLVAQAHKIRNPYDLIILDLDMPILNGFEACKQIRDGENAFTKGLHTLLQLESHSNNLD